MAGGNAPAARSANCRNHADNSKPSRAAACTKASFCSADTLIRTTSSFNGFPLDGFFRLAIVNTT